MIAYLPFCCIGLWLLNRRRVDFSSVITDGPTDSDCSNKNESFQAISPVRVWHFSKIMENKMQCSLFVVANCSLLSFSSLWRAYFRHSKWPVIFLWDRGCCRLLAPWVLALSWVKRVEWTRAPPIIYLFISFQARKEQRRLKRWWVRSCGEEECEEEAGERESNQWAEDQRAVRSPARKPSKSYLLRVFRV